ncbi:MAG TPA: DUF1016 family protein [Candidatus Limisoma intestinavium]|uniref:DUF1016 family protein n=1 Tax=Candidatus Limisoma intestinavium TaxID=2840856 RepID=A0A9D1LI90_9BACT|nr:DUF1016 family protein [Candidatus Limisoma intestinavium]
MEELVGKELSVSVTADYIADVKQILEKARAATVRHVNHIMVEAYWLIGERIVKQEQHGKERATYGEAVLKELSKSLTSEFGNGFSYANLRNMRQFYLTYPDFQKCYTVCSKLSWSHNRLIMRVSDKEARDFYLRESIENQWSVRQLERNINSMYYQRLLSTQVAGVASYDKENDSDIRSFIKDPYVMEYLGFSSDSSCNEKKLEDALIDNLQSFLLELGKGFSFVGRQYRISTETSHFYIDLVFYNYILKCFVIIDLKTTKLTHQDVGQMDMYRRMFDDLRRTEGDNPTIGILLCAERDETIVKYSVINDSPQLFASKYLPYLPTEKELKQELETKYRQIENRDKSRCQRDE